MSDSRGQQPLVPAQRYSWSCVGESRFTIRIHCSATRCAASAPVLSAEFRDYFEFARRGRLRPAAGGARSAACENVRKDRPDAVSFAGSAHDLRFRLQGFAPARDAARLGVLSSIHKSTPVEGYAPAILALLDGRASLSVTDYAPNVRQRLADLSPCQRDVAALLGKGLPNKQIAMTQSMTKAHVSAVYRVLGVVRRKQAVVELMKIPPGRSRLGGSQRNRSGGG